MEKNDCILIVDDEPEIRRLLVDYLTRHGLESLAARDGWCLDTAARLLSAPDGVATPLSGGEYRLLRILLDHPNRVITRDQLTEMIHGHEAEPFDRAIDVQVSRLRQRLRDDSREPQLIKTVRGEGYVLATCVEERSQCP